MEFFENVKKRRISKGYSLDVLSEKSTVSRAMLSKIERNEKQPTIKVAAQIAEALDTTISELLGEKRNDQTIKIESNKHLKYVDPDSGFERVLLSPNIGSNIELIINKLPEHKETGYFPAHTIGTNEYIYILKGEVDVELKDNNSEVQKYKLLKGDSFYFEAHKSHRFINNHDEKCEYILVIDSHKSNRT